MTPSNQQNNQSNQSKSQSTGGSAPLANKAQNDQMMGSLKDIDSKLAAHGRDSSQEETREASDKSESSKTGSKQSKNAGRSDSEGSRKSSKEVSKREEGGTDGEDKREGGLASLKNVSFDLNKAVDLSKSYFAKDKTLPYLGKLGSEVGEQVVDFVQDWASKNNAKIDVKVTGIQGQTTAIYGGLGAVAGAGLGSAFGGKIGGLVGLVFGAALGTAVSCVNVSFKMDEEATEANTAPVVH